MHNYKQLMSNRFSCRKFQEKNVEADIIKEILSLAQKTPSWCNSQVWQVEIVSGKKIKSLSKALFDAANSGVNEALDFDWPKRYVGIYQDRRKECGIQLYQSLGIGPKDKDKANAQMLENFLFFNAPHIAIISTSDDLGVYGAIDCGLYISNFILSAGYYGVNTVPQAAVAKYPSILRKELNIGDTRKIVAGISFGYADKDHAINKYRTSREKIDNVAKWHQ